jgi:signal transduction histidine kinase
VAHSPLAEEAELHVVPSPWPALIGLGVVVALSLATIGIDLVIDDHTAAETSELVDNSLRSVTIADDLRNQVHRLARPSLDRGSLSAVARHIAEDAHAYNPLATSEGEVEEWSRLQLLLDRLQREPTDANQRAQMLGLAEGSIDRLIEINSREAKQFVAEIREAHQHGLVADIVVGMITLVLAIGVAVVLLRTLRRQHELVRLRMETLGERTRDLEQFAARTAHDLKGPLAPLRGYADLLGMNPNAHAHDLAAKIARATDRMATIIDDLLALSLSGQPPAGEVDVQQCTHELLEELSDALDLDAVDVSVPPCVAACAPGVCHQIMRNVLTNALKFRSPDRPLRVRIDARRLDDTIEIAVTDNGIGMNAEAVERAFEPFYRARTVKPVPGHGLGLAIVKRTIDALGGNCRIESELAKGTRIVLRIPAVTSSAGRARVPVSRSA